MSVVEIFSATLHKRQIVWKGGRLKNMVCIDTSFIISTATFYDFYFLVTFNKCVFNQE